MTTSRASKLRQCAGKKAYPSEQLARGTADYLRRTKFQLLHPYRCNRCRQWHLGHRVRQPRRQR